MKNTPFWRNTSLNKKKTNTKPRYILDNKFIVRENTINGITRHFDTGEEVGIFMLGRNFDEYSIYVRVDRPYTIASALEIQLERMNNEC